MKVVTYVESYDDITFWRNILNGYESDTLEFEVMLPSRTSLSKGKKSAIMNDLGKNLGTSMIACVDADYDYLMQEHSAFSREMLTNPFVIHTFVYAIENYQCYAPSLHNVCTSSTLNDRSIFDFESYLEIYSRIIYELFIWHIWTHRSGCAEKLPMGAFNNIISIRKVNYQSPEMSFEFLQKNVNRKIAYLQRECKEAKGKLQPLRDDLRRLGVVPENTYLFIQGHSLVDNVVLPVLTSVCTVLRKEREREIFNYACHDIQRRNELSSYQHSQTPPDEALRRNNDFRSSMQFGMLRERLQTLIDLINNTDNHDD